MSGTGEPAEDGGLRGAVESAIDTVGIEPKNELLSALSNSSEPVEETKAESQPEPEKPAEAVPKATDEQPSQPDKALDPHANWPKEAKEHFAKLDKQSQQFLLDRERDMQADYTRKTQELAALRRDYEPVDKMFAPYKEQMKSAGQTPFTLIEGWANVEKALMQGKGVDVIRGIIQGYKIDPKTVIAALGAAPQSGQQQPQQQTPAQQAFQLPPDLQAKLSKIDQFESRFQAEDKARRDAEIARVSQSIEEFKSAKDDKGNVLHPHFDEVESQMAILAQMARAQGKEPVLKDLYESAVYANPSTREKVLAAQKQSEEKRLKEEARAKAEKARKASSSVTGSSANGSSQPLSNGRDNSMSLRDQIQQSFADISQ